MPVNVTVGVERETTVEYTLQAKNVKLLNVPEGLKFELEGLEEEYPVSVTGIRSVMSGLTEENLEAAVDVAEWAREQGIREVVPGRYLVALQFNNPEYTEIDRPVTVSMTVSEVTEEDTEE